MSYIVLINDIYNQKIETFPNPLADKLLNEDNNDQTSNERISEDIPKNNKLNDRSCF